MVYEFTDHCAVTVTSLAGITCGIIGSQPKNECPSRDGLYVTEMESPKSYVSTISLLPLSNSSVRS